jgi:dTMP kinase
MFFYMINKPYFITFEGGEGSGKTTQSRMLHEYLLSKNQKVILTREIGGTLEAEKIRELIFNSDFLPISELLLVMAARYEHIYKVILPALSRGESVICDRFVDSTACYQGQVIGIDTVYKLHKELMSNIMPDITFFIDLQPTIAMPRTLARGGNNKFEDKDSMFHQKVYEGFHHISQMFKDRIITIEASNLTPKDIHSIIVTKLWHNYYSLVDE